MRKNKQLEELALTYFLFKLFNLINLINELSSKIFIGRIN